MRRTPFSRAMIVWPSTISILATSAKRHGSAVGGVDRQAADGLGRGDDAAVELGDDVEAPVALVERADRLAAQGGVDQPLDVVDAHVVAGAEGAVRVRSPVAAAALPARCSRPPRRGPCESARRSAGPGCSSTSGVRAGELDGQVRRSAVGVLGDAVDDRLREVEARGGKFARGAVCPARRPARAWWRNASTARAAWGRPSFPCGWAGRGRCRCRSAPTARWRIRSRGNCRTISRIDLPKRAVCSIEVPSGKLARIHITPSSM